MNVTKELMQAYFANQASSLQKKLIAEWLADPAHQEQYFQWLEEWERRVPQYVPDVETAARHFHQQLHDASPAETRAPAKVVVRQWPVTQNWQWAAAVACILAVGGYLLRNTIRYTHYSTEYGQTYAFTLSDGSQVTLNGHSELAVPRFGFGESTRRVNLAGEAVFSVKHTPTNQRFIVETPDQSKIEVLGTEFSVVARSQRTQVELNQGKIKLHYVSTSQQEKQLIMNPGDWVTVEHSGQLTYRRRENPQQFAAWRDHRFVFDHTTLRDIVQMLQETYDFTVTIADDTLAARTLTGTFHARTPDELLEALAELLDLKITHADQRIILQSASTNL